MLDHAWVVMGMPLCNVSSSTRFSGLSKVANQQAHYLEARMNVVSKAFLSGRE
jgi:hypothetical protein